MLAASASSRPVSVVVARTAPDAAPLDDEVDRLDLPVRAQFLELDGSVRPEQTSARQAVLADPLAGLHSHAEAGVRPEDDLSHRRHLQ
jgi:hypothetical protein